MESVQDVVQCIYICYKCNATFGFLLEKFKGIILSISQEVIVNIAVAM